MKKVILSDVDGTILSGSLVLDHACWLEAKGIVSLGEASKNWLSEKKNEKYIFELGLAYRKAIAGMKIRNLRIDEFFESYSQEVENYNTSVLAAIEAYRNFGYKLTLVTGSPCFLVEKLAKHLGAEFIATKYKINPHGKLTGNVYENYTYAGKKKNLKNYIVGGEDIVAFGDTRSDEALFELARKSFLCHPTPRTIAKVKHEVEIIK